MKLKSSKYRVFLILILIISPWLNSSLFDEIKPPQPSQENNTFYEVNICEVSLFEFLLQNPNTVYQDHFQFRTNEYSSISCFGKVSGLTEIDSMFYISIGTNALVSFLLQALIWIILLSFIPKSKTQLTNRKIYQYISIFLVNYLFIFSIYSEKRFYEDKFYSLDLQDRGSYVYLFFFFLPIVYVLIQTIIPRVANSLNFLPFLFLINFVLSGFNTNFLILLTSYFGIYGLLTKKINKRFLQIYGIFSFFWVINSTTRFSFYPSKLRGFTSSSYDFNATLAWAINFALIIFAINYLYKTFKSSFDINKFTKNMVISSSLIISLGFIASNFPFFNFLSYFFLGLQRYGVTINNPFLYDEFAVKIPWRGIYPSAETVGEFFGLSLLFVIYLYFKNFIKIKEFLIYSLPLILGLFITNNRTSTFLVLIFFVYYVSKKYKFKKNHILIISILFLIFTIFLIGFQNFTWSFESSSGQMFSYTQSFSYENESSSFFNFLKTSSSSNSLSWNLFNIFSYFAFLINRSQLWGIFFARYNPSFLELILGSGPLNFGQLYGEISINETQSLLLPHSSLLSYLQFFGILGISFLGFYLLHKLIINRNSLSFFDISIVVYILLNIAKNDSLNYFSANLFYIFLINLIVNKKNYSFESNDLIKNIK